MKKNLFVILVLAFGLLASCDYFVGPAGVDGAAGADGMLATNLVTGTISVPPIIVSMSPGSNWIVTLDDDLDASNGIAASASGVVLPGQTDYGFSFIDVPAGSYYLFAFTDSDPYDGEMNDLGADKTSKAVIDIGSNEAAAFYGVFTDAQVQAFFGDEVDKIHPAAPNVTVPDRGWTALEPFSLIANMPM